MSKTSTSFQQTCKYKIPHATKGEARKHLREIKEKFPQRRHRLVIYKCPFGDHYHVGRERKVDFLNRMKQKYQNREKQKHDQTN